MSDQTLFDILATARTAPSCHLRDLLNAFSHWRACEIHRENVTAMRKAEQPGAGDGWHDCLVEAESVAIEDEAAAADRVLAHLKIAVGSGALARCQEILRAETAGRP